MQENIGQGENREKVGWLDGYPRLWKEHFAQAPLRPELYRFQQHR
ncbi:hypothetical protein [Acidithiobacillus sp.]